MIEEDIILEELPKEEFELWKKGVRGRQSSRRFWTKRKLDSKIQDIRDFINSVLDTGYCDGYNTVLQAYEELFGLDERYWKLVDYLDKVN